MKKILLILFVFFNACKAFAGKEVIFILFKDTIPPPAISNKSTTDSNILIVLDGKISGTTLKELKHLDSIVTPASIERINVLKGASALSSYGEKGKYGVIEIFTKKNIENAGVKEETPTGLKVQQKEDDENKIFEKVDAEATFNGSDKKWIQFLQNNLNADVPVINKAPVGTYKVLVQFIVHKDGSLSDFKAITSYGYGLEKEALRVIKKSPNWIPAMQNGTKVNAYRNQPITFTIKEERYSNNK